MCAHRFRKGLKNSSCKGRGQNGTLHIIIIWARHQTTSSWSIRHGWRFTSSFLSYRTPSKPLMKTFPKDERKRFRKMFEDTSGQGTKNLPTQREKSKEGLMNIRRTHIIIYKGLSLSNTFGFWAKKRGWAEKNTSSNETFFRKGFGVSENKGIFAFIFLRKTKNQLKLIT